MILRIANLILFIFLFHNLSIAQTALEFDGIDDYVYFSYDPIYTPDSHITIETWLKQDTIQYWPSFISYFKEATDTPLWSGYQLGGNDMGNVCLFIGSDTTTATGYWLISNAQISDGNWHHLAVVIKNDTAKLYVNGLLDTLLHVPNAYYSPSGLRLGTDQFGYVFKGTLDEIRMWDVAKSIEEINNLKDSCLNGNEANLVAYFSMEDEAGNNVVTDYSTTQNNGTQFNMDPDSSWVIGYNCLHEPPLGFKNDLLQKENIQLYPNPFNNQLNIKLNESLVSNITIKLYKTDGQIVFKPAVFVKTNNIYLDLKEINPGMYFIHVTSNYKTSKHKIIKL